MIDYTGTTAPNSAFILPQGQLLSTTTYAAYFSLVGTTYNTGGETTGTFRAPDVRGRVSVAPDTGVGRITGAALGTSGDGIETIVNGTGGEAAITSNGANSMTGGTSSLNGGVGQQPTPTLMPFIGINKILRIL